MQVLLDTNILLRLVNPADPEYLIVRSAVDQLITRGDQLCFASQNLVEFWNVCTRPADKNGLGLTILATDARAVILENKLSLLTDSPGVHQVWRRLVVQYGVAGVQVHDARLVATMLDHGVSHLLTLDDRDFVRFQEITVVHPRDLRVAG